MNGHARSVTFVGSDKLNKTLVSAGSDGLVLVFLFEYIADLSYGTLRQLQLKDESMLAAQLRLAKCKEDYSQYRAMISVFESLTTKLQEDES